MPFCPKCGKEVPQGATTCSSCGAQIGSSDMHVLNAALRDRNVTDKEMSLGWWLLISIVTLGIGAIVARYYLIKRQGAHFERQRKLEEGVIQLLQSRGAQQSMLTELSSIHQEAEREEKDRNAALWTILSFVTLGIAGLYVMYFLTIDPGNHALRQRRFTSLASKALTQTGASVEKETHIIQKRSFAAYLILTIVTLGIFGIYWTYVLFKDFNEHFEDHKLWEESLSVALTA